MERLSPAVPCGTLARGCPDPRSVGLGFSWLRHRCRRGVLFCGCHSEASPEQGTAASSKAAAADGAVGRAQALGQGRCVAVRGRSGPEQRDAPRSPAGLQACQLALSARTVWARCPNSHLARRYGITDKNPAGDYWKKVPGTVTCFTGRCRALRGSRGCVLGLTGCSYGSRGREPPARAPPRLTLREGSHHPSSARVPRKGTRCWATHFELGNRHRSWVAWGARSWKVPCLGLDPGARLQLPSPRPG